MVLFGWLVFHNIEDEKNDNLIAKGGLLRLVLEPPKGEEFL